MHPDRYADGKCETCGKPVCYECKLEIGKTVHCKTCVESGKLEGEGSGQPEVQQPGVRVESKHLPPAYFPYFTDGKRYRRAIFKVFNLKPEPSGRTAKELFYLGAAGGIIGGIASVLMTLIFSVEYYDQDPSLYPNMVIYGSSVYLLAMVPFVFGLFGFYKNYGSPWGLIGSLGLLVALIAFTVGSFLSIEHGRLELDYYTQDPEYFRPNSELVYVSQACLGFGLMLASFAIVQGKNFFKPEKQVEGLPHCTAITMFVAGILFLLHLGSFYAAWGVLASALFMMALCFYDAPVPETPRKDVKERIDRVAGS
jgi:hypothetical protein